MFGFTKKLIALITGLLVIGSFVASPAGANDQFPIGPGGNGPDVVGPIIVSPPIFVLPSASVSVSCVNETATATIKNPTTNYLQVSVEVDGAIVKAGTVGPKQGFVATFPIVENDTRDVIVRKGAATMLEEEITRNCLLPDPSYSLLKNCETSQVHARLRNDGDDTAKMAAQLDGQIYALQAVAPHSSIDWLLAIDPGETKLVTIKHGASTIGSESFSFSCPQPEPEPQPEPAPVEPEPQPEPAPVEPEPQPVEPTEPALPGDEIDTPPAQDDGESTSSGTGDDEDVATEVLGETVEDPESDTNAIESGDIDEIVRGAAGSIPGSGPSTGGGMSFFKIAMMAMWVLVVIAGGLVAILATRRNAQTA
jgi:hypothetical protein